MSSMAALVFLLAATTSSPPAPSASGVTAEQAMARYRSVIGGAMPVAACPGGASADIIVCGRDRRPPPRLPMPEERAEAGESVHHLGEPGTGDPGPRATPSKLGETLMKGVHLLKSAVTGEDPVE